VADLTVTCFFWHDSLAKCRHIYTFGPEHVRILQNMVRRNLTVPHEFVCVTDRPQLIDFCRTVALDKTTWVPGTRYVKLMMYRPDAAEIIGPRIFYLDLDCVITGSLDPLVDRDEDLVLWRNPNFGQKRRARYNSSIQLIRAGSRPDFWRRFDPKSVPATLRKVWGGTDQAWISYMADVETEAFWDASHGVYGAGRLKDYDPTICGTKLPVNARVVFFPGSREPGMPAIQEKHPWIKDYRF
jgi:hypothetical protein